MKLIKSQKLFNGRNEDRDVFIGFEGNDITYISNSKQDGEIIAEGVVTPAFIDAHGRLMFFPRKTAGGGGIGFFTGHFFRSENHVLSQLFSDRLDGQQPFSKLHADSIDLEISESPPISLTEDQPLLGGTIVLHSWGEAKVHLSIECLSEDVLLARSPPSYLLISFYNLHHEPRQL
jgi:hypothetical protein